jgi:hypothetical protein
LLYDRIAKPVVQGNQSQCRVIWREKLGVTRSPL